MGKDVSEVAVELYQWLLNYVISNEVTLEDFETATAMVKKEYKKLVITEV